MANEVIIEEYAAYAEHGLPVPTQFLTTQIKDIATAASALNGSTKYVRIRSKGTGFWYSFNGNAVANTAGSSWLPADQFTDHAVSVGTIIDTAA